MVYKSLFSRLFRGSGPAREVSAGFDEAGDSEVAPQESEPAPATPASSPRSRRAGAASVAPVFILGYAPDAAILLTRCLIAHGGLAGHEQGLLLPLLVPLNRVVTQFFRSGLAAAGPDALIRHVEPGAFQHPIRRMFIDIMADHHAGADWIDNTQGLAGIQAAAVLRTLWPRGRFIFLANRVLESIASVAPPDERQPASLRDQGLAWARGMEQWTRTRQKLGADCLTLDRRTVLRQPEAAAAEVARFLKLDASQAASLALSLSHAAGEAGGFGTPLDASAQRGWDGQDGEALRAATAAMMTVYGYSWDGSYFAVTPSQEEVAP